MWCSCNLSLPEGFLINLSVELMYGEMRIVMTFLCNLGYCLCAGFILSTVALSLFLLDEVRALPIKSDVRFEDLQ